MSLRKQKNEVNRTRQRLMSWLDQHPHGPAHFASMFEPMVESIASKLSIPAATVSEVLTSEPYAGMVASFLYEEAMLKPWRAGANRPIDDFNYQNGQQERIVGRKFLANLANSTPRIWQIVSVDSGRSLSVKPFEDSPTAAGGICRVYDRLASASISTYKHLFARVLTMPDGRIFSTSLLPLRHSEARKLRDSSKINLVQTAFVQWGLTALQCEMDSSVLDSQETSSTPSMDTVKIEENRLGDATTTTPSPACDFVASTGGSAQGGNQQHEDEPAQMNESASPADREKLLERIRKLYAMAQETQASPHEAEIALRRCQKLMARFGIQESDLHTSQFSAETFRAGHRVPTYVKWLATAVELLHSVLFVWGGGEAPEFRGYEIDVKVAKLTMEYLVDAVDRSLGARRRAGSFPAGRSAAYDYRVAFAMEVHRRVGVMSAERAAAEAAATVTGNALTVRKMEIVERECGQDLVSGTRYNGARDGAAADAGRIDGGKISLDPQINSKP